MVVLFHTVSTYLRWKSVKYTKYCPGTTCLFCPLWTNYTAVQSNWGNEVCGRSLVTSLGSWTYTGVIDSVQLQHWKTFSSEFAKITLGKLKSTQTSCVSWNFNTPVFAECFTVMGSFQSAEKCGHIWLISLFCCKVASQEMKLLCYTDD